LNLHGKGTKQLTLESGNEQVLFALPQFAITNYMEFKDEFYPGLNAEDKKEYDDLFADPKNKDETLKLRKFLFGKTHTETFYKYDENQKDKKIQEWSSAYVSKPKDKKPQIENLAITKNRPFHCFEVDQVSYIE